MLGAELAVPIHYNGIDEPGLYEPVDDAAERFAAAAAEQGVETKVLVPGEELSWAVS